MPKRQAASNTYPDQSLPAVKRLAYQVPVTHIVPFPEEATDSTGFSNDEDEVTYAKSLRLTEPWSSVDLRHWYQQKSTISIHLILDPKAVEILLPLTSTLPANVKIHAFLPPDRSLLQTVRDSRWALHDYKQLVASVVGDNMRFSIGSLLYPMFDDIHRSDLFIFVTQIHELSFIIRALESERRHKWCLVQLGKHKMHTATRSFRLDHTHSLQDLLDKLAATFPKWPCSTLLKNAQKPKQ